MQEHDITENLFQAIDTIIAARVRRLAYDRTEIMTILDATGASNGIYKVSPDGQYVETIYSDNPTYKEGDQVYVTTMANSNHKFINSMYMRRNGYSRVDRRFIEDQEETALIKQLKDDSVQLHLKSELIKAWKSLNLGFDLIFDSNGIILNSQEMYDAILQAQQDLVDQYNSNPTDAQYEIYSIKNNSYTNYFDLVKAYESELSSDVQEDTLLLERLNLQQDFVNELQRQNYNNNDLIYLDAMKTLKDLNIELLNSTQKSILNE